MPRIVINVAFVLKPRLRYCAKCLLEIEEYSVCNYRNSVYYPLFFLLIKHVVSETGFCLRLQVGSIEAGSIYKASLCLRRQDDGCQELW
jgi:hypothetical protein